jgi:hypothetical protein
MFSDLFIVTPVLVSLLLLRVGIPLLLIWLFSKTVPRLLTVLPKGRAFINQILLRKVMLTRKSYPTGAALFYLAGGFMAPIGRMPGNLQPG